METEMEMAEMPLRSRPPRARRARVGTEGEEEGESGCFLCAPDDDDDPHVRVAGRRVEILLVDGEGPWRLDEPGRAQKLATDGLCYCAQRQARAAKEARAELAAYGMAPPSTGKPSTPMLQKGLDALYAESQDKTKPPRAPRTWPWLDAVGSALVACGSLGVPALVRKGSAFLRMTKVTPEAPPLRCCDASAVAAIIEHRGQQIRLLAKARAPEASSHADNHWQTLSVLLLDVLLGAAAGTSLTFHQREIGDLLFDSVGYHFQSGVMRERVFWVLSQHAPLGFKLNHGLDEVLGNTVLVVVDGWHVFTAGLAPYAPRLVLVVGAMALLGGGLSLIVAFACDAAVFVTLHIQFLYNFLARLHRFQLAGMSTFWKVMRGKKRNVLRGRVDTGDYDTGDLLFGSMAFLVFGFLFQTTLAYYVMLSGLWVAVVLVHGALLVVLKIVQSTPIYALWQTWTHPTRLPRGVVLDLRQEAWGSAFVLSGLYAGAPDVLAAWVSLLLPFALWGRRHVPLGLLPSILRGHQVPLSRVDFPRDLKDELAVGNETR